MVPAVQVFSSDNSSAGVYWMFYSGASFEAHAAPVGLPGLQSGTETEGLRCVHMQTSSPDTAEVLDVGGEAEWNDIQSIFSSWRECRMRASSTAAGQEQGCACRKMARLGPGWRQRKIRQQCWTRAERQSGK